MCSINNVKEQYLTWLSSEFGVTDKDELVKLDKEFTELLDKEINGVEL